MTFVAHHPVLDRAPFTSQLSEVFGHVHTIADVLHQIGHDERVHKIESLREAARRSTTS
jgi:ubiquinol oxidase